MKSSIWCLWVDFSSRCWGCWRLLGQLLDEFYILWNQDRLVLLVTWFLYFAFFYFYCRFYSYCHSFYLSICFQLFTPLLPLGFYFLVNTAYPHSRSYFCLILFHLQICSLMQFIFINRLLLDHLSCHPQLQYLFLSSLQMVHLQLL